MEQPARETEPARDTGATDGLSVRWSLIGLTGEPLEIALGERILVLGRGADCDVELSASEASRRHAEIARAGPVYTVRDLGSSNGTFVNGKRVHEAALAEHALLRLGNWLCVLVRVTGEQSVTFREHAPGLWGGATLATALEPARAAAASDLPIVIEGETGTGKELAAQAIHAWSGRSGPLLAINCAALPASLAEAELFGYRRGAFTGAERASAGYFRAAERGTLLLDEICDLPLPLQSKLLRVLEQREVVPLGETRAVPIDVRVVAAAQESLQTAVKQQRFRADLCARLEGVTICLPPLRARSEDIPALLRHFISSELTVSDVPRLSANATEALCLYDWPFNVRELHLLGRRLAVLHAGERVLRSSVLPARIRDRAGAAEFVPPVAASSAAAVEPEVELERFLGALRSHRGNVSRAAREAGISRMRAYRLMHANPQLDLEAFRLGDADREP